MNDVSPARVIYAAILTGALSNPLLAVESPTSRTDGAPGATKATVPISQYRATTLLEMRVKNSRNEELGVISELLIDKQGRVSYVILQAGGLLGMGEHRYAVPWDRVSIATDRKIAVIDVAKEKLDTEFSAFEPQEERPQEPLR